MNNIPSLHTYTKKKTKKKKYSRKNKIQKTYEAVDTTLDMSQRLLGLNERDGVVDWVRSENLGVIFSISLVDIGNRFGTSVDVSLGGRNLNIIDREWFVVVLVHERVQELTEILFTRTVEVDGSKSSEGSSRVFRFRAAEAFWSELSAPVLVSGHTEGSNCCSRHENTKNGIIFYEEAHT